MVAEKLGQASVLLDRAKANSGELVALQDELDASDRTVAGLLGERSFEQYVQEAEQCEIEVKRTAEILQFYSFGKSWLQSLVETKIPCPVCGQHEDTTALLGHVNEMLSAIDADDQLAAEALIDVEHQVNQVDHQQVESQRIAAELRERMDALDQIRDEAAELFEVPAEAGDLVAKVEDLVHDLNARHVNIQRQIEDATATYSEWERRRERIRSEVDFQNTLSSLRRLETELSQLEQIENRLGDLTAFGGSVREIRVQVEGVLRERLIASAPQINSALTRAFRGLTEHPTYDQLLIDESQLPKLDLLVSSSADMAAGLSPSGVLNGQALSALELVPYFAFSELTEFPFDVYLLLLDDPTQSFDENHIRILVERLAELGKRVQLVVASHEIRLFEHLLAKSFDDSEYALVKVAGFTKQAGPGLAYV